MVENSNDKPKEGSIEDKITKQSGPGCLGWGVIVVVVLAIFGSLLPESDEDKKRTTTNPFNEVAARMYCGDIIKKQLNDPDSYRFESAKIVSTSGEYNQYGEAVVFFRAKNAFGGYIKGFASCEAYEKDGALWHRAVIQK